MFGSVTDAKCTEGECEANVMNISVAIDNIGVAKGNCTVQLSVCDCNTGMLLVGIAMDDSTFGMLLVGIAVSMATLCAVKDDCDFGQLTIQDDMS